MNGTMCLSLLLTLRPEGQTSGKRAVERQRYGLARIERARPRVALCQGLTRRSSERPSSLPHNRQATRCRRVHQTSGHAAARAQRSPARARTSAPADRCPGARRPPQRAPPDTKRLTDSRGAGRLMAIAGSAAAGVPAASTSEPRLSTAVAPMPPRRREHTWRVRGARRRRRAPPLRLPAPERMPRPDPHPSGPRRTTASPHVRRRFSPGVIGLLVIGSRPAPPGRERVGIWDRDEMGATR
jgi:hypothetical protein